MAKQEDLFKNVVSHTKEFQVNFILWKNNLNKIQN